MLGLVLKFMSFLPIITTHVKLRHVNYFDFKSEASLLF